MINGSGVIHPLHFPVKAKRIIHLCMAGGPSHLETFDCKPELESDSTASRFPNRSPRANSSRSFREPVLKARGPFVEFAKYGKSGKEISEPLPAHCQDGRRHLHHPLDDDRADQP